jgi:glycosyltransferase involved in cell wall biosynthesis
VGYVGRIEPRKGTIDLMRAAPAILAARPSARIVVVGDDDFGIDPAYADEVRELAGDPALQGRVELLGSVPGAHRLMPWFDVFAFPSLQEPGGTVAAEALSAGVPVVATEVGGVPEVVGDPGTGRLVPPADPDALAAGVVDVLADPDRAGMTRRAREASRAFSAERSADVLEEALWDLRG